MYRFLIIDDEPVVREGIAENIDWGAYGFELVGSCRDGREGLRAVEELRPDVVLTDICMPFVDGLELAGSIAEEYPGTKTILLTGYDEFEYAQEAVKLKVSDFLLKPITPDELRQLLVSIRSQLDEERNRLRRLERLQEQLTESLPLLRERFLNRLITGVARPEEIARRIELLDLSLSGPWYAAVVCDPDAPECGGAREGANAPEGTAAPTNSPDDLDRLAVENIVETVAAELEEAVTWSTLRDEVVVLLSAPSPEEAVAKALECGDVIADRVAGELGHAVSIGTGDPVDALTAVSASYRHARLALEHRQLLRSSRVITAAQVRGGDSAASPGTDADARARFVRTLKGGDIDDARLALAEILSCFDSSESEMEHCLVVMHRLLGDVLNALETLAVDYGRIPELGRNPFGELNRLQRRSEIERWFLALVRSAQTFMGNRRKEHSQWKAEEAKEFIRSHYTDAGLSLRTICNALAISKSYLSSVFKAHTGMTVVEFLTNVRMEAAKELLASECLKSYEVATRVGFRDAHYFSLTFKKQTGITPTEYRELARQSVR
ncbi:MAG: response regulator [Spirochaetota bacterium]